MSHAQALQARLANAIAELVRAVPAQHAATFPRAVELLQSGHRALTRDGVGLETAGQSGTPAAPTLEDQDPPQTRHEPKQDSHPDLEEWLASSADVVTGEVDRRRVPIRDLLTADRCFVRTAGQPGIALTGGKDGWSTAEVSTASREDELLDRIAEALHLIRAEASTWSPQAGAQTMALLRYAEDELTERCER